MKKYKQLYNRETLTVYSIDRSSLTFTVSKDQTKIEVRIKPFYAEILYALFTKHKEPVSYSELKLLLQANNHLCQDDTRLHRKVSELRRFLAKISPGLDKIIINTRGVGYSLPLHLSDPETLSVFQKKLRIKFFKRL